MINIKSKLIDEKEMIFEIKNKTKGTSNLEMLGTIEYLIDNIVQNTTMTREEIIKILMEDNKVCKTK